MISSDLFMLANLVLWIAILVGFAMVERRGRFIYRTRDRRIRYRRLSTEQALARLRKARPRQSSG